VTPLLAEHGAGVYGPGAGHTGRRARTSCCPRPALQDHCGWPFLNPVPPPHPPQDQHNNVARFLEAKGMVSTALEVAVDPEYR
jgi:hypothetical protein